MTKDQILKLVKEYFTEGGIRDDGSCVEYYGDPDAFVRFAEMIYEKGEWNGEIKGYYKATGGRAID